MIAPAFILHHNAMPAPDSVSHLSSTAELDAIIHRLTKNAQSTYFHHGTFRCSPRCLHSPPIRDQTVVCIYSSVIFERVHAICCGCGILVLECQRLRIYSMRLFQIDINRRTSADEFGGCVWSAQLPSVARGLEQRQRNQSVGRQWEGIL